MSKQSRQEYTHREDHTHGFRRSNFDTNPAENPNRNYKLEKKINKGDLDDQIEIINSFRSERNVYLPIENYAKELVYTVEKSNVTIVIGETGCGKTTKIPEFLFRSGRLDSSSANNEIDEYRIAHILPRRIATMTVADRVAKNLGVTLGKEVGYSVRFDYNYSEDTKIKFLTEGMFVRELLLDPLLNRYNTIIIDDCHERTINSELIFGFLKKVFAKRKDLKVIISSATLDYQCYQNFFSKDEGFESNIFVIKGRTYPVDIFYTDKPVKNYIESAVITAANIHKQAERNSGDILVFLTGQEDINLFFDYASSYGLDQKDVILLPLCAGLPVERQLQVFAPTPHNKRKIVVSTNIAEASVTIENIAYVIDSGLVKMKFYNAKIDADAMYIIPASKFSLDQRAGRAGRTRPGQCFRLITKSAYQGLYQMTNPELLRSNLSEFVLRLKSMGVKHLNKFETITPADKNSIARALEGLYFLGVIDDQTNLTELGERVCDLPLDPKLAVSLFKSAELKFNCIEEMLIIVSMLSVQNLFHQPGNPTNLGKARQRLGVIQGDHLTLLNIYREYKNCKTGRSKFCRDIYLNENAMKQVDDMIHNLKPYLKKYNISVRSSVDNDGEDILKSLLKGFFLNIAQKQSDGSYRSLRWNIPLHIHPSSVLYSIMPEYVLYHEVVSTAKNYVKEVSQVDKKWVMEIGSHFYEDKTSKVIQERHKEEVKMQMTISSGAQYNRPGSNSITKHLEKSEQIFKTGGNSITDNKINSVNTKQQSSRIYMEVDKNKDYSYYFEDSGDEEDKKMNKQNRTNLHSKERNSNNSKLDNSSDNKTANNLINEDDIEEITMLRRMRKRK